MSYSDVTLSPEDIEWDRWPDREDVKDALFNNNQFDLFLVSNGLDGALERVTQFHREVANQLIVRAVDTYRPGGWVGRTIRLCRRAKARRNQLRRLLAAEIGWDETQLVIDALDARFPRAVWGADT